MSPLYVLSIDSKPGPGFNPEEYQQDVLWVMPNDAAAYDYLERYRSGDDPSNHYRLFKVKSKDITPAS